MPPRHTPGSDPAHSIILGDRDPEVVATKLVSMGELLLLEAGGDRLKLDAMLLEGVSWQRDAGDLTSVVDTPGQVRDDPVNSFDGDPVETAEQFTVANEYTTVEVGAAEAADALQVSSQKGVSVLGPQTLRALTTIDDTGMLSRWFRTPIGPEQPL